MKPETLPLDPARFDAMAGGIEKLWGLETIAAFLGVSVDTARRMANEPEVPIYRPGGRYFAYRSELRAWLRSK